MDRLPLLHTLLEREKEKRDAAMAEWREAERLAQAAREQADSLVTYRGEYRKRWAAQFAQRAPIEILHCYQGFIERLEQAIGAQQGAVDQALARLTRLRGLRTMLRMMRGPASAAGLADLQHFLETGFDTFADLGKSPGGTDAFLRQIETRETALIQSLFDDDLVTCETTLAKIFGKP